MSNLLVYAGAALIPLAVGFAWYSPFLFAKPWMAATGMTQEKMTNSNRIVSMIVLYVFSFFLAFGLAPLVVHQLGLFSMLGDPRSHDLLKDSNSELHKAVSTIWGANGHMFRRYRHGALHGAIASIVFALPIIAVSAAFEGRSVKYVLITWGYWFVNFTLMGAVVCHWLMLEWPPVMAQ